MLQLTLAVALAAPVRAQDDVESLISACAAE